MTALPDANSLLPAIALAAIAVVALLAVALRRVPEGYALTLQRLGRYRRTLGPGWHMTVPVLDRAGKRVTLVGHHVEVQPRDQRQPEVQVYYQILEPARTGPDIDDVDALVGREALQGLETLAVEPGADLPALAARLKVEMNRRLDRLGLLVIRCQLHVPTL